MKLSQGKCVAHSALVMLFPTFELNKITVTKCAFSPEWQYMFPIATQPPLLPQFAKHFACSFSKSHSAMQRHKNGQTMSLFSAFANRLGHCQAWNIGREISTSRHCSTILPFWGLARYNRVEVCGGLESVFVQSLCFLHHRSSSTAAVMIINCGVNQWQSGTKVTVKNSNVKASEKSFCI